MQKFRQVLRQNMILKMRTALEFCKKINTFFSENFQNNVRRILAKERFSKLECYTTLSFFKCSWISFNLMIYCLNFIFLFTLILILVAFH